MLVCLKHTAATCYAAGPFELVEVPGLTIIAAAVTRYRSAPVNGGGENGPHMIDIIDDTCTSSASFNAIYRSDTRSIPIVL